MVGAIAGFDFGLMGGGVASILATVGVKDSNARKYHDALVSGKYIVVVHGHETDISKAKEILDEHGTHEHVDSHLAMA